MPHETDLLVTFTGGLAAALAFGFLTHRLGLSSIVGYLLAGILVGPYTPGFAADPRAAEQLAEIGVVLLMFGVGLHFRARELWAVRRVAVPGALLQIAVATFLGTFVGIAAGWTAGASIVFGLAISVASTVVLVRVLSDAQALHTPSGHLAVGWLVLEDIFTVLVLVLLPEMAEPRGARASDVLASLGVAVLEMAILFAVAAIFGRRLVPLMLGFVARARSRELFTLAVLVVALGLAVLAASLFGVSMALGAFLAGLAVGQTEFSSRAASEALPMRHAFAVLFFVSIGMMLDPAMLVRDVPTTLATIGVVLLGKPFAACLVVLVMRRSVETAVNVGIALAQIGEFSFILATLGISLGVLEADAMHALVVTAIATITLNPLLFAKRRAIARALGRLLSLHVLPELGPPAKDRLSAVVVGYGPVGRALTKLLRENDIVPTVIELNLETARALQKKGIRAIYGDAKQRTILEQAGIRDAQSLLVTASDVEADAMIREAKALNPRLFVLTRVSYLGEGAVLSRAGADGVVAAEGEVALAMAEHLLTHLGATAEQVERERARVHADLARFAR